MSTLQEKQSLLKELRTLMSRVESMETSEETAANKLPFPEETTTERAKGTRLNDGSMYLRPFSRFLSKRYGTEIDVYRLKGVLKWAKVDCNSRNTSHDWWINKDAVKNITELMDIIYGLKKI